MEHVWTPYSYPIHFNSWSRDSALALMGNKLKINTNDNLSAHAIARKTSSAVSLASFFFSPPGDFRKVRRVFSMT